MKTVKKVLMTINQQLIQDSIKCYEYHLFRNTRHIVCCATMVCGYTVIGESACVNPDTFNVELGQSLARQDAERKVAELLAYEQLLNVYEGGEYEH